MGLGDCPECWDGTCTCGYMYRDLKDDFMVSFLQGLIKYRGRKALDEMSRAIFLAGAEAGLERAGDIVDKQFKKREKDGENTTSEV